MATHPDDPKTPKPGDEPHGAAPEGQAGKPNPKHTKMARQPGKPTMLGHDQDEAEPPVPNLSLEESATEIPVLERAEPDDATQHDEIVMLESAEEPGTEELDDVPVLEAASDDEVLAEEAEPLAGPPSSAVTAEAVSDIAEAEPISDVAEAEPVFDDLEAKPVLADRTGADVTGAEHVLEEELFEAQPASGLDSSSALGSDVLAIAEPASGVEDVLGDERLERGSRPSARVESPIRTEMDEDAVELGGPPSSRKRARPDDLDLTEEVLAGEPGRVGSSAVNWNDVGGMSDVAKPADDEATLAFDTGPADEGSAVNLGGPTKAKSASGIDVVAEALESGVNLDDDVAAVPAAPPSVEFDDILSDEAAPPAAASAQTDDELAATSKTRKKKKKNGNGAEAADVFGSEEPPSRKRPTDSEVEDAAAAALFSDDEDAVGAPVEDDEAVAAPVDDDEAVAAPVEDEEEVAPKKKSKGRAAAEDEEEPVSRKGRAKAPPVAASGPGCFGTLVRAGSFMLVGMVLLAGAAAGLVFSMPELADEYYQQLPGVALKKPGPKIAPPTLSPVELATQKLVAGQYDEAFDEVKDDNDPTAQSIRGEARFLKHAKDAKAPLAKDDPEVKKAIEELRAGKNDVLANQIEASFDAQGKLAAANQLMAELQATAQKAGVKTANAKELPKVLAATLAGKKQADEALTNLGDVLAKANVADSPEDATPDKVAKKLKELNDTQTAFNSVNKALKDADVKDTGVKGVAELLTAKKDADEKLSEVNKVLADAKIKDGGAKGVAELIDTRTKLQKDRDDLEATTKAAYDELVKAKVVAPGSDPRKGLVAGTKAAREKAESPLAVPLTHLGASLGGMGMGIGRLVEKTMDTGLLAAELGLYRVREPFIQTPVQKLDTFALLLQDRGYNDAKTLGAILRETDWVLSAEAKASPAARAKALYVKGLALRNEGKFDEARKALEGAAKNDAIKSAPLQKQAARALTELTDPRAYYLPQIDTLQTSGDLKGALAEADKALAVLPGDGKLLAERALLRLEAHRGKGKLTGEVQQQIRKDAGAALKSPGGAAEGAYVLGRLEEEQGQYAKAEEHYRAALKAHQGNPEEASRYRGALARVLLFDRPAAAAPPPVEKAPPAEKKDTESRLPTLRVHPVAALLLPVLVGQVPDEPEPEVENAETAKRIRESIDLAKSLATSKDVRARAEGYGLLAQAAAKAGAKLTSTSCIELGKELLSQPDPKVRGTGLLLLGHGLVKQGRRTEGLKEYVRGLELLHPGLESRDILKMVEEHPAFQHPDATNKPNPVLSEKHFGHGLHLYWSRKYPEAEVQFKQALDYFGQDARYAYYLGLSQLAQRSKLKRDQAYFSFERGAQLEAQSRPGMAEINTSLERIQGELRQLLNSYRFKGVTAAATP